LCRFEPPKSPRGPHAHIGRKNHYGSRSERGTRVAALFYSPIESAKLAGVEPRAYLSEAARGRSGTQGRPRSRATSSPRNPERNRRLTAWERKRQNGQGLTIDGDPLEDITILTKPEENLALLMKDGKIYKKAL
jgi:hypothetical protein